MKSPNHKKLTQSFNAYPKDILGDLPEIVSGDDTDFSEDESSEETSPSTNLPTTIISSSSTTSPIIPKPKIKNKKLNKNLFGIDLSERRYSLNFQRLTSEVTPSPTSLPPLHNIESSGFLSLSASASQVTK